MAIKHTTLRKSPTTAKLYQINQPQPQLQQQLPPQNLVKNNPATLTTDQLLDAMRPIAELFNFFRITER